MNNGSPTPRRYTSRPDLKDYGFDGLENRDSGNRYMNPREKLIPRQYYENARTVDELLSEIKMLSRQLREQQERELKLRNLCETLKGKLGKYFEFRELALRYKHERDELSYKLYKRNIYDDEDENNNNHNDNNVKTFDFIDESNNNKNSDDDQIYVSKKRNNHYRNNSHRPSISTDKSGLNKNGNDLETKELITKLYEMISSLKHDNTTLSPQYNANNNSNIGDNDNNNTNNNNNEINKNNSTDNKSKYLSERDLDIIKTEELKKLEDAVQEYRHRLEARKAYEKRKISAQQEILQIQEELRGLDTGFNSLDNNNINNTKNSVKFAEKDTRNESTRPKSRNKSKIRERFDDIGNEYDETSFFQTNST